ncbi:hypothetical protein SS50377_25183 [Spironucleus salmonicida]|uniref:Uncharacterized protein n=1 Tax=Spironucleus salmonicida TaxID=348837 RepID=A0A9P8RXT0_9EUKA|nr:hypothetical protein SS50377_25183 [Spironucleus salmonicida]
MDADKKCMQYEDGTVICPQKTKTDVNADKCITYEDGTVICPNAK